MGRNDICRSAEEWNTSTKTLEGKLPDVQGLTIALAELRERVEVECTERSRSIDAVRSDVYRSAEEWKASARDLEAGRRTDSALAWSRDMHGAEHAYLSAVFSDLARLSDKVAEMR